MENNKGQQMKDLKDNKVNKHFYQKSIESYLKMNVSVMKQPLSKWVMNETLEDTINYLTKMKQYIEDVENFNQY